MKKITRNIMLVLGSSLLCSCCSTTPSLEAKEDSEWMPLFGEKLSGAIYTPGVWSEKDGVLISTRDEVIFTKRDWANFELELEFKINRDSNSGVVLYCTDIQNWIPNSIEVQIADNNNKGFARPTWRCASIFGHVDPEFDTTVPYGEWQKMKIVCNGPVIDVWLNGKHASTIDMLMWKNKDVGPDGTIIPKWLTANRKCDMPTIGKIGLQGMHGKAATDFRKLRIKSIKQPPAKK